MEIIISNRNTVLSTADDTYLRNRLYFGLASNYRDIDSVEVLVNSAPGAEPEMFHRCRVDITMDDGSVVVGDSMETNLYVAMDRAVDRACSGITRNVDWNWRAFSQTEPTSSRATYPSLAA